MMEPERDTMWLPTRRSVLAGFALATLGFGPATAEDSHGVSEWSVLDHGRVRLIDAGPSPREAAQRLVGIQVELDSAYLTYWRSPGEAGLPPSVSFAGSTGVKADTLLFPAPGRYSEGGTEAIGYKDSVVFPVLLTPKDATQPITLKMVMDFGICERQCLPAQVKASLMLGQDGTAPEAALVRDALSRVPVPSRLGAADALSIVALQGTAGDDVLTVLVRSSGSDVPLLFAEAPDPWFIQAGQGLWSNDGTLKYRLTVMARPTDPAPLPLRLTLVATDAAIEVPVDLDAPPPKP